MTASDMNYITVALPKGKLFGPAAKMLMELGYAPEDLRENSRKLVITNETGKMHFIITKPADLPTYVEYGAADIGIIGKDVLLEDSKDVYELMDLKFGFCRMMVAVPQSLQREKLSDYAHMRVATKYPRIAQGFFHSQGIQVEIIKLNGSIELAPMVGLAEIIVDLVETGRTLRENNLVEVAEIHPATARFIANRVSFKMKSARINRLLGQLKEKLESGCPDAKV
ncbi:ATP phosphoribosyltransferase [Acetonema longum]|uniref:ATP phosphoribosyltransferase n=1 Tax=Acetonema longum DSM 6540 TaxID=1009370 RepID=F7NEN7_9FIRM|nr:ATP phosphoribosyltransferase [Acetonema longum]EGO65448.1 ATP phosphoribosyltransferase catalytic subunit [Acetonema longum DSM 6540]